MHAAAGQVFLRPDGLPLAAAEVLQLLLYISLGQARQRGVFRPALAGGRVAVTAGDDLGLASRGDDLGQGPV